MDPPTSIRAAMGADHDDDGDMEPVFIDEGDCEVALDLDEEDDAPMDSDDEIEGDPDAPIEDRDAEGTEGSTASTPGANARPERRFEESRTSGLSARRATPPRRRSQCRASPSRNTFSRS